MLDPCRNQRALGRSIPPSGDPVASIECLFVPPPDQAARLAILQLELAGRPQTPGLDPGEIARKTSGFSGADLRNLVKPPSMKR